MVPVQLQLHHRICPRCRSIKREFDALAKEPQPLTGYYWAAASHAVTQRQQQQPAPSQPKPPIQPAPPSQPVLGHLEFSLGKATARKPTDACPCPALEPGYLPDGSLFAVPSVLKEVARNAAMQIRDDGPPEVPLSVFVAGRCRQCNRLRPRCDAVAARRLTYTFAVRPAPMRRGSTPTVGSALMARRRRHTMELLYLCNGRHILLPAGLSCSGPAVHAQLQIARSDSVMGLVRWAMAASSTSAPRRASSGVHVRT